MASIEEAKDIIKNTPISSIVSFYHPISKRGANYEGICPFHSDTKPSMKVNDNKGIYKCFACGAAGDSIKFVQDFQSVEFIDAIKDIGNKLGIVVEENQKKKANPKMEMGLRVLTSAYKLYKKYATEVKPEPFKDFLKKRNINQESVTNFGLGYAPKDNFFLNYLNNIKDKTDREYALSVGKETGIIRDGQNGRGDYDFFRDRVVFPIWDHFGNVRGFSSRSVFENQKPKYLNSGESFIFDKGNILYGFNLAKPSIRDKNSVLIVEGNMDAVVLHQFGFTNSVATMGVALSENSSKLLASLTKNIYLAMDSDDAGFKGMTRINELFLSQGIIAKYVNFEPSKDPDEFLNEFGRLKLIERIDQAPAFIDTLVKKIIPAQLPETTEQKLSILDEIFKILSPLEKALVAKEKLIEFSGMLGLNSSAQDISDAYENYLDELKNKKDRYKSYKPPVKNTPSHSSNEEVETAKPIEKEASNLTKAQSLVLGQLIMHPECTLKDEISEILDFIDNNEVKRLINWLKSVYMEIDDSDYVEVIKTKLEEDIDFKIKEVMAKALFDYDSLKLNEKVIEKLLIDLRLNLKKESYKFKRADLVTKQKSATNQEEMKSILKEITDLDDFFLKN